ncbi:UDP-glucose 4-epimerase GalE [Thorsellia kenyensis]|uniref:UDP-glucose 4-epimerase n=1 Tax=Thorsellia kenyensis TaxID=1549888 RepID=A0ABV6CHI6_9GAMM
MNILVTGGLGYIGSHTCIELINAGYHPIVFDNLSNAKKQVIDRIKTITGKEITFVEGDIRDESALSSLFEKYQFNCVIHFAGLKAVGESVQQPLKYYDVNVNGTLTLLRVMQHHNVYQLIFSSSATVYGIPDTVPIEESAPTGQTTNPYATSKYMVERVLEDTSASNPHWKFIILRYFNPVGAHQSGLIGEDPQGIPNNLMPFISQVAVGKRDKLSVYGNDYETKDGTGVRDYLHVVDLAKGHLSAVKYISTSKGTTAFNLGTGNGLSVLEVVEAFKEHNKVDIPYVITERRAGDIDSYYANNSKAKKLLNWQAELDLEDMVKDTWHWQSNNPNGYDE